MIRPVLACLLLSLTACGSSDPARTPDGGPGDQPDAEPSSATGVIYIDALEYPFMSVEGALAIAGDQRNFYLRGSTEATFACPSGDQFCYVVTVVFPEDTALGPVSCDMPGVTVLIQGADNQLWSSLTCGFTLAARGAVLEPLSITGLVVDARAPDDGVLLISDGHMKAPRGPDEQQ
jgi:hypothetical protein